eukprot:TRINITY_DN15280_c0_g1_i1.p1 TRINITY_DN15280_c0_g1~~TRINITY_DN15280_c0_g1_i1.p1  ORF type:complete len:337 (+),score=59.25 TRINITY_DN15280_c0_g1_i1:558-1568(+)
MPPSPANLRSAPIAAARSATESQRRLRMPARDRADGADAASEARTDAWSNSFSMSPPRAAAPWIRSSSESHSSTAPLSRSALLTKSLRQLDSELSARLQFPTSPSRAVLRRRKPPGAVSLAAGCDGCPNAKMHPRLQWGQFACASAKHGGLSGAGEVRWRLSLRSRPRALPSPTHRRPSSSRSPASPDAVPAARSHSPRGWSVSPPHDSGCDLHTQSGVPGMLAISAAGASGATNMFTLADECGVPTWCSETAAGVRFVLTSTDGCWCVRRDVVGQGPAQVGAGVLWSDHHQDMHLPHDPSIHWWRMEGGCIVPAGVAVTAPRPEPLPPPPHSASL